MTPATLTKDNLQLLGSLSYFAGVVFIPQALAAGDSFSPAGVSMPPGFAAPGAWNPVGRDLISQRWRFPIISVSGSTAAQVLASARNNAAKGYDKFPQEAIKFSYYMGPQELNTYSCLDGGSCLPLGGQSVWGTIGPLDAAPQPISPAPPPSPQRPIVMLTAAMDANSLFHDQAYGADATVSGVVAVLAAVDALSRSTGVTTLPLQIAYGIFQGEQWGNVGSRRWLQEIASFTCATNVSAAASSQGRAFCANPLRTNFDFTYVGMSNLRYVLSADGVGAPGAGTLYVHEYDNMTTPTNRIGAITDAVVAQGGLPAGFTMQRAGTTPAPPPSPLATFLTGGFGLVNFRADTASFGTYDTAFASKFYASEFDNSSNVDSTVVANTATMLAHTTYALATNNPDPAVAAAAAAAAGIAVNTTLVDQMVRCFTVSARCALFQRVLGVSTNSLNALFPASAVGMYTSVYIQPYTVSGGTGYVLQPKPVEAFVRNFLAAATATVKNGTCTATKDCQQRGLAAFECLQGMCTVSNAFYHDAISPGISPSGTYGLYTYDKSKASMADPLWTEPYWSTKIGSQSFMMDSAGAEIAMVVIGVAVVLASIGGTWSLVRYLDLHYKTP